MGFGSRHHLLHWRYMAGGYRVGCLLVESKVWTMEKSLIVVSSLLYLGFLFFLAYWAESKSGGRKSSIDNGYVYSLSLAIYCTAWTYYGSVGRVLTDGLDFLTVYLGPTLMMWVGWTVLRKINRICKVQRITSIADFISARYGKNRSLGVLVTIISMLAGIPYIALQIKAIASSFQIVSPGLSEGGLFQDYPFYIVLCIIAFTLLFGTRRIAPNERHEGAVFAIAFESIVKLLAFLVAGIYVTFYLFDGFADVFSLVQINPTFFETLSIQKSPGYVNWFFHLLLAALAFLFLPRQFQVAVVENVNEENIRQSIWLFPLYLFLINIFVIPIALAGEQLLAGTSVSRDSYVLAIPLLFSHKGLALFIYLGGFSAATGMIMMETIAISTMLSNNLFLPWVISKPFFRDRVGSFLPSLVIFLRRFSVIFVVMLGYVYYQKVADKYTLVSIGMTAFVAVAQFAPAALAALFWKRGTQKGAFWGLIVGIVMWIFLLIIPSIYQQHELPTWLQSTFFSLTDFLRLGGMDDISTATFWCLLLNSTVFYVVSVSTPMSSTEHNQAILFTDIFHYSEAYEQSVVWRGQAMITDIKGLLISFLGKPKTERLLRLFATRNRIDLKNQLADPRLVNYAEKILAGMVGSASARLMVSNVTKEENISLHEVVTILKESQQLAENNKELQQKSHALRLLTEELSETNEKLVQLDKVKNEFLAMVTHEIRTPLTSIKAMSEIITDNPDLEEQQRLEFLKIITKESERLSRLVNQVLDLEKYESGTFSLTKEKVDWQELVEEILASLTEIIREKGIRCQTYFQPGLPPVWVDQDKMMQVMLNLLGNAIKFVPQQTGEIVIDVQFGLKWLRVVVSDNGPGIDENHQEKIFLKFFQSENQLVKKPLGSGLGLAISKKIIELHGGSIHVENRSTGGAQFLFKIPLTQKDPLQHEYSRRN